MGKWTVQHTEDVLLSKIRVAIQDAIEMHRNENRQDGEARPVTLNEFVEALDAKDAFTAKMMEILVKEYSERRAKGTPVNRRFQIASRTSRALEAIPQHAAVYHDRRASRRPYATTFRNAYMEEDDRDLPLPRPPAFSLRDELFQNALEELEDGEFGAHWNSSLNDVYATGDTISRLRQTEAFQPIPIVHEAGTAGLGPEREQEAIGAGDSVSSSSIGSDAEGQPGQNTEQINRFHVGPSLDGFINRQSMSRAPLLRRNSLRRSRYDGRPATTSDATVEAVRRRYARQMGGDGDAIWSTSGPLEGYASRDYGSRYGRWPTVEVGSSSRPTEVFYGDGSNSSGATFRRLRNTLNAEELASGSSPSSSFARRGLRRGGLQAPESILPARSSGAFFRPPSPGLLSRLNPDNTGLRDSAGPIPSMMPPPAFYYPSPGDSLPIPVVIPTSITTDAIPTPPAEPDTAAQD